MQTINGTLAGRRQYPTPDDPGTLSECVAGKIRVGVYVLASNHEWPPAGRPAPGRAGGLLKPRREPARGRRQAIASTTGGKSMVEVKPGEVTTANLNAVQVHVYVDPADPRRRLATITYGFEDNGDQITCRTLIDHQPMSDEQALALARHHAERHGIPEIYYKKS